MERNNFYYLFTGLIVLLAAEPWLTLQSQSGAVLQFAFTGILVFGVWSLQRERPLVFRTALGLAAIALATAGGFLFTDENAVRVVNMATIVLFCALTIAVTLEDVLLRPKAMSFNRVVGALSIFLLFGVIWSILFAFVEFWDPDAFHYAGPRAGDPVEQFLYYSFVTLTTLGYGDITPLNPVARTLAYLEAVTGQLYLAVLVAGLVGRHVAHSSASSAQA